MNAMLRVFRRWRIALLLPLALLAIASCDSDPVIAPLRSAGPAAESVPLTAAQNVETTNLPTECPVDATRWLNAVNGSWLDAARWSAGVPTATTPACIDLPGTYVVTIAAAFGATVVPAQGVFLGDPGAALQPTLLHVQGKLSVGTDITVHGRLELAKRLGLNTGADVFALGTIAVAPTGTLTTSGDGGSFEAAIIESDGTLNAGAGVTVRAATFANRSSVIVPAGKILNVRGPASGGAPNVIFEAGAVATTGALNVFDGTLLVRGGTVTGTVELQAVDELRIEHDAGGRFDINPAGGFVPTTITRLSGTIGPNQHVWMGLNHLTVTTPGLINQGQLTVHHVGAHTKTTTILRTEAGATLVNEGTLTLQSSQNSAPILAGAITNAASGLIANASDHAGIRPAPLINHGTIRIATQKLIIAAEVGGPPPEVRLEGGKLESVGGRYQQTGGSLTVLGGDVEGQLDLIALSELRIEHDGGGRFNLTALGGQVPPTTSRLSGVIGANQHVWMGNNHLTVVTPALINRGQLTVQHVGAFQKTGTVLRTLPGATLLNEGTLLLQSSPNSSPILAGAITNAANGLIANASDHAGIRPAPLINHGTIHVASATLVVAADVGGPAPDLIMEEGSKLELTGSYSQTGGNFRHHNAAVTGAGRVTFSGVRFSGFGTWARALALTGSSFLAPGASPGRMAIAGDYSPSSATVTDIELSGAEPGTGYDQIAVAGTARFLGSLRATLVDGFVPRPCQTFEVVTYAGRTGTFANSTTPIDVGGGIKLRQVYTNTGLVLVAFSANGPNVHPTQVEVSVDGETDTYDVCIGAGSDVITVSPDDQVNVDKRTLTFGASQLPQTVTVSAAPGATRERALITHTAASGIAVANVNVLISGVIPADINPPITRAVATPAANEHGWNRADVAIALSATDEGSGVKEIVWQLSGAQSGGATVQGNATSLTVTAEGHTRLTYFARDVAGNQEAAKTLDVRIDKTAPSVTATRTPLANEHGWNNTDVTASFTAIDALSGVDGTSSTDVVFTNEGANQSATPVFRDRAGNEASATIEGISIDKTPPTVTCAATPNEIWPPNNKLVPVSIAVTVDDALSGAGGFLLSRASSNEPEPDDIVDFILETPDIAGSLRAARLGNGTGRVYTFEYRGLDLAGNASTGSCQVRVPHDQGQGGRGR